MNAYRYLLIPLFVLISFLLIISCGNRDENDAISTDVVNNTNTANGNNSSTLPKFDFETTEHDFGKIIQGETISFAFKFKNIGNADLLISAANGNCGCTVPNYPKTPISPGEQAFVKVAFNSDGRKGYQNKTITIIANTQPNTVVLKIKAMIVIP